MTFVAPDSFPFSQSILFLLAVIVGGAGWVLGPVVGAAVIVVLPELLVRSRRIPPAVLRRAAAGRAVAGAGRHPRHARPVLAPRPITRRPQAPASISPRSCGRRAAAAARGRAASASPSAASGPPPTSALTRRPGAGHQRDRPQRRRQDHRAQHDRRLLSARRRQHPARRRASSPARRPGRVARAGIARTYQTTQLFGTMSVLDNVLIALRRGRLGIRSRPRRPRDDRTRRRGAAGLRRLSRARSPRPPATCRTSTAAWSRSPARSPRARRCCCSTSRPRA